MQNINLIENYIYIYLLDKYVIIPSWPDSILDSLGSTFLQTSILARTAPIYSYSYSGPRAITFSFNFHRDLMSSLNANNPDFLKFLDNLGEDVVNIDPDDYIDVLIKYLQAMALPAYQVNDIDSKMIKPPIIAVRLGNDIFIKGVVVGSVNVTRQGPISRDLKYQEVLVNFTVNEIDPQDASSILKDGSFRGLAHILDHNMVRR